MLVITLIVAATFCSTLTSASDVLVLTDSDFESKVASHPIILVEFYAPWCGHCKRLAPEYEQAATILKNNDPPVPIAKVDCTAETKICEKHGVSGYPTLKVFKSGAFAYEYGGGRDADGIVKYMRGKAGPTAKQLFSESDLAAFTGKGETVVIGFFSKEDSDLHKAFKTVADGLSEDFRFGFTASSDLIKASGHKDTVVIYLAKKLHNKFEPKENVYSGAAESADLRTFVEQNIHGVAGILTGSNMKYFNGRPFIVASYNVDYEKDPKGTNYWRNRFIKVGQEVCKAEGKTCTFAVTNTNDNVMTEQFGLDTSDNKKVHIIAKDSKDQKYVMPDVFNMDNFRKWLTSFLKGTVDPYLKSEDVPASNDEPVKVVVAKNFDKIVNDESKDVLVEFYAPWCGHCKTLAPKYDELAKKLSGEKEIVIAKMDATANDVPPQYEVRGFPTLYFAPKGRKQTPVKYEGGREVDDFVKYLAAESTNELSGFDRSGNAKKSDL